MLPLLVRARPAASHGALPSHSCRLLGVDFKVKFVDIEDQRVKLTIWDTAGQERFRTLTSSYYRGAHGVILVYDVTSRDSFDSVRTVWMRELQTYANPDEMVLMLVANKIDKAAERTVSTAQGQDFAKDLSALYMECSAKTKVGIQNAFEELVQTILHSPRMLQARRAAEESAAASRRLEMHNEAAPDSPSGGGGCSC